MAVTRSRGGRDVYVIVLAVIAIGFVVSMGSSIVEDAVHQYIWHPKTLEARHTLRAIGDRVIATYARDGALCPSATQAVPAALDDVVAKPQGIDRFYQSASSEWQVDARRGAGFSCLGFEMDAPQFYQYSYESTRTSFVVRARGDLDGDRHFSTFELRGELRAGTLIVEPELRETNPNE